MILVCKSLDNSSNTSTFSLDALYFWSILREFIFPIFCLISLNPLSTLKLRIADKIPYLDLVMLQLKSQTPCGASPRGFVAYLFTNCCKLRIFVIQSPTFLSGFLLRVVTVHQWTSREQLKCPLSNVEKPDLCVCGDVVNQYLILDRSDQDYP